MQLKSWICVCALLSACAAALPFGCSSKSSGSRPSNQDGGTDAQADATADAAKACSKDSECDDGDPCNGLETCDTTADTCKSGTSPCAPPSDPAHCEVVCINNNGQAQCGAEVARDFDKDGHGDKLCTSSPGDDCDDTNKDIHPGATEQCDGIDGDCDGKADIDEGLPLGGKVFNISAPAEDAARPQAVWIPGTGRLGVVWSDARTAWPNQPNVGFSVWDETGKQIQADTQVSTTVPGSSGAAIATDGTTFGVAWTGTGSAAYNVFFRLFAADGSPKTGAVELSGFVQIDTLVAVAGSNVGYVVTWIEDGAGSQQELWSARVGSDGKQVGVAVKSYVTTESNGYPSVVTFPTATQLLFVEGGILGPGTTKVRFAALDAALKGTPLDLTQSVAKPGVYRDTQLGATPNGLFGAWASSKIAKGSLHVSEFKTDGTNLCGPVTSANYGDDLRIGGVDVVGDTRLVAIYDNVSTASATVRLLRFDASCTEAPALDVSGSNITAGNLVNVHGYRSDVAVGDNKIAVVWDEKAGANAVIRARIFGKNFCD